jgi:hypothetical protein
MATPVPIKGVLFPTHLEAFVFAEAITVIPEKDPQKPQEPAPVVMGRHLARLEVYKGYIETSFGVTSTSGVEREEFISYLPTTPFFVYEYSNTTDLPRSAVIVTTYSVSQVCDETSTFAVDEASVSMELDKRVPRLILKATVAAEAATVHTICYDVTVLTKISKIEPKLTNFNRTKNVKPKVA